MESTILPVLIDRMYAINITAVNLLTYSETGITPRQSTIVFKDTDVNMFSSKTNFNIIAYAGMNLSGNIQNGNLTAGEISMLQTINKGFIINRSNFSLKGFKIESQITGESIKFTLFKVIYQQSKAVNFTNIDIDITGGIFETFSPINLYLENIYIDYSKTTKGFYIVSDCNYASASIDTAVSFTNITVIDSESRISEPVGSFLTFGGPANFTFKKSNVFALASELYPFPQIQYLTLSGCNPNDTRLQTIDISDNTFRLSQSTDNDRFIQVYASVGTNYIREVNMTMANNVYQNVTMNSRVLNDLNMHSKTNISLSNLILENITLQKSAISLQNARKITLNTATFRNITQFGRALVSLNGVIGANLNTITIDQCQSDDSTGLYYIEHTSTAGYMNITGLSFTNMDTYERYPIYLSAVPSLKITNSYFTNIALYPAKAIAISGILSELSISNVNFTQITSSVSGDDTNIILEIAAFDVSKTTTLKMDGIIVTQSTLKFMQLVRTFNFNTTLPAKNFTISNFKYTNSAFTSANELLVFQKMERDIDFTIRMTNITFDTITFPIKGYVLLLQQQLRNALKITNLELKNLKNALVYISAFSPQNKALPTKVEITNLTTSNCFGGYTSLFNVYENTQLDIYSSAIRTVYNLEDGAVLYAGYQQAKVNIYDTVIENNAARQGGVFKVENDSKIKVHNSRITKNFAVVSGIIIAQNNGQFEFTKSNITENGALAIPIAQLFDVPIAPLISNCIINKNLQYTKSAILTAVAATIN